MNPASSASPPRLTGRHVLIVLLGFFGTIASADAFLIYSAVRSWTGAEATSAYKAGQLYNAEIEQARLQAALGWRIDASAERQADQAVRISIEARDRTGQPLSALAWSSTLQRPTDKREDRMVPLSEGKAGFYAGTVAELGPGQWDLVIEVSHGGERIYRRKTRLVLR
jgi:nitrogen fixation protein FixH